MSYDNRVRLTDEPNNISDEVFPSKRSHKVVRYLVSVRAEVKSVRFGHLLLSSCSMHELADSSENEGALSEEVASDSRTA
jgi:glycine cleavage system protein P-like pyridoxal-binding family